MTCIQIFALIINRPGRKLIRLKRFNASKNTVTFLVIICPFFVSQAQKPILVHNADTTYLIENPMLDNITVTGRRIQTINSIDQFVYGTELTTSISGLTKDLQRDLPSLVRIYTPQGIPLLTKYISSNSLTAAIPDSAVRMELVEPGAKFPNPDAPVIVEPDYEHQRNILLSPIRQSFNWASGYDDSLQGSIGLSHTNTPELLQYLIPELESLSTTYSGYSALRAFWGAMQSEIIIQYSKSSNEYGELFDIDEIRDDEQGANLFINTRYDFEKYTLNAGLAFQSGWERRYTNDLHKENEIINRINAYSYTAAVSRNNTEFRLNIHNIQRVYSYSHNDTLGMQRLESLITHSNQLTPITRINMESRFDHKDLEPSLSAEVLLQAHRRISLNLNTARLYDAVGSEGLNNVMRSVQRTPHPWETLYARFGTTIDLGIASLITSFTTKKAQLGWYGKSANMRGWVARLRADGILDNGLGYLSWNVEGAVRNLSMELTDRPSQVIPGPARLEGHAELEAGIGRMKYTLQSDAFIDRHMRITDQFTHNLGPQYFLAVAGARKMGPMEVGLKLINSLALLGQENKVLGHYSEAKGFQYVTAPPFLNLTLGINF